MTETYTYDAFGTLTYIQSLNEEGILAETDTALSRFLYAGEQYDVVTGLYYLRARRYDTTVGRFTQEDTYLGDGRNLYVYVQNNPLKYVDPSGYDKNEKIGNGFLILISGIEMALTGTVTAIVATSLAVTATVVASPALAVAGTIIMVATAAMGAGMAIMGVSDATQGTVEIYNAVTGNSDLAPNLIRDTIFGGDQEAYNQAEALISFGATVGLAVTSVMPLVITTSTSGAISYYANINTSGSGSKSGSDFKGQMYNGTRNSATDFVNGKGKSTLDRHASDHGYTSSEAYLEDARYFLEKEPTTTTQSFVSEAGTYFRYDTATNEFGIINEYGGISTYFKPDNGMAYWLEQIEKYAPK